MDGAAPNCRLTYTFLRQRGSGSPHLHVGSTAHQGCDVPTACCGGRVALRRGDHQRELHADEPHVCAPRLARALSSGGRCYFPAKVTCRHCSTTSASCVPRTWIRSRVAEMISRSTSASGTATRLTAWSREAWRAAESRHPRPFLGGRVLSVSSSSAPLAAETGISSRHSGLRCKSATAHGDGVVTSNNRVDKTGDTTSLSTCPNWLCHTDSLIRG